MRPKTRQFPWAAARASDVERPTTVPAAPPAQPPDVELTPMTPEELQAAKPLAPPPRARHIPATHPWCDTGWHKGIQLGRTTVRVGPGQDLRLIVGHNGHKWQVREYTLTKIVGRILRTPRADRPKEEVSHGTVQCRAVITETEFTTHGAWYYDWRSGSPMKNRNFNLFMRGHLDKSRCLVPSGWMSHEALPPYAPPYETITASNPHLHAEKARLTGLYSMMLNASRAETTNEQRQHPALKALWYWVTHEYTLPPTPHAIAVYLTRLVDERCNAGSATAAYDAIQYLGSLNTWPGWRESKALITAPEQYAKRQYGKAPRKAEAMYLESVTRVMTVYCRTSNDTWSYVLGAAIVLQYKCALRYSDLAKLRYDEEWCTVYPTHIRFYLERRKTAQYGGEWIDVAKPADSTTGAYDVIARARELIGQGYVLPRLYATSGGRAPVNSTAPMGPTDYARYLRTALIVTGVSEEDATVYTTHSARHGAASQAHIQKLSPLEVKQLTGASDPDWLLWYDQQKLKSRLELSRKMGL